MRSRSPLSLVVIATIAVFLFPLPLHAQNAKPVPPDSSLKRMAEKLAQRYHAEILIDPTLDSPAELQTLAERLPLPDALNALSRQLKNGALRRVSLPEGSPLPSPEKLAAMVRALDRLPQQNLLVENPQRQRAALFLPEKRIQNGDKAIAEPVPTPLQAKTVYLIYNTAAPSDGKTRTERLADLQNQQIALMARLPTARRSNPIQTGLQMLQSLAPAERNAFLQNIGQAGLQTWQGTSPDVRNEMMQQFMQTVQQSPPVTWNPNPGGGNAGATDHNNPEQNGGDPRQNSPNRASEDLSQGRSEPRNAPASRNNQNALKTILETLSRRYQTQILLDPTILPTAPPQLPPVSLTLDQAMEALAKSLDGTVWRRVYTAKPLPLPSTADSDRASPATPPASPAKKSKSNLSLTDLIAAIRTLESLPQSDLIVTNLASQRPLTFRSGVAVPPSLPAELTGHGLAPQPTLILYTERAKFERELLPDRQIAEIQRQQCEMLKNMTNDEIELLILGEIEQFQSGDADTRSERMRLPLMAALMAVWMPRKAQENKNPPF